MFLTVKEACPFVPVVPVTVVMAELPPLLASVTVLPLTALLFASLRVTVMVEVAVPRRMFRKFVAYRPVAAPASPADGVRYGTQI